MPRVDIHAHLLPSLDDGPKSMAESVAMAMAAAADGTGVIVATPHQRDVMLASSVESVRRLVVELEDALAQADGGSGRLRVLLGMENHIEPDLPRWVEQGKALTLNGTRFILAEPPVTAYPSYVDRVLRALMDKGLTPVIAHPERNVVLQRDMRRVREMAESGMVMQVTAGSFLGAFGPAAQRGAELMLRQGLAHVVASDMHAATGHRSPALGAAFDRVAEIAGEQVARLLFEENPLRVVEGRGTETAKRRRGFGAWLGRLRAGGRGG